MQNILLLAMCVHKSVCFRLEISRKDIFDLLGEPCSQLLVALYRRT